MYALSIGYIVTFFMQKNLIHLKLLHKKGRYGTFVFKLLFSTYLIVHYINITLRLKVHILLKFLKNKRLDSQIFTAEKGIFTVCFTVEQ